MALFAVPIFHMKNKKTYDGSLLTEAESDNVICSSECKQQVNASHC